MDANECETVIPAARNAAGKSTDDILANVSQASAAFRAAAAKFGVKGEW